MPDPTETVAQDSTPATAPESTGSEATPAATTAVQAEAPVAPTEAAQQPDPEEAFWKRLSEIDPDELLQRNAMLRRKIDGKVGELSARQAQRLAQQTLAQVEADRKAREEQARLDKLAEEDPYELAEEYKRQKQEQANYQRQFQDDQARDQSSLAETYAMLHSVWEELPERVQKQFDGRHYDGPPKQGMATYWRELVRALRDTSEVERDLRAKIEKEVLPTLKEAARKEALAEVMGQEESPDIEGGGSTAGAATWNEIERHRGDMEWFRANEARVDRYLSSSGGRR